MSNAENGGGLALATSPMAKKVLGISNVTRKYDMPYHKDLLIVPPRMNLYIQKNLVINNIFRQYVSDEDILIYSIDETFIRITASKRLFHSILVTSSFFDFDILAKINSSLIRKYLVLLT